MSESGKKRATDYSSSIFESFRSMIEAILDTTLRKLEIMMPCRVVNVNRKDHTIIVQPLVKIVTAGKSDGDERAAIRCTTWRFSAGNFVIDVPVLKGDTGWVISSDRDTDLVKGRCLSTGGSGGGMKPSSQNPLTANIHQFRHGIFIPDRWQSLDLYQDKVTPSTTYDPGENRLTIQSVDGKQRISIGTTGGKLTLNMNASDEVNIITTGPGSSVNVTTKNCVVNAQNAISETTDGTITEKAVRGKTVTAPTVTVNGNLVVNGTINATGDVLGNTVSLYNHVHSLSGGGTTGQPVH